MSRDMLIRSVDEATATRVRVIAAHYGISHAEVLSRASALLFDKAADEGLFGQYGGKAGS